MPNINLPLDDDLYARIEAARGDVPRVRWLRRAAEQALANPTPQQRAEWTAKSGGAYDSHPEVVSPVRQHVPGPNVENIRSSAQSKRDVRPIPKRGS